MPLLDTPPPIRPLAEQFAQLPAAWRAILGAYLDSAACQALCAFVDGERAAGKVIYPFETFHALHLTPPAQVKVVILGQDPYHGEDPKSGRPEAHGLAFSVPEGVRIPPSLRNIFKELAAEFPQQALPPHGNLTRWAEQGVLLLNTVLSVEKDAAASHALLAQRLCGGHDPEAGWEAVTDRLIGGLQALRQDGLVFMLWGAHAQRKARHIDETLHALLRAPHPSPLSAHRGFFGCHHFQHANQWLAAHGRAPIHW